MLIHLTIVFNIERLDVNGRDVINIQSYVYGVIVIAILTTLISRLLQRYSVYFGLFFWITIYAGFKIFVFTNRPLMGGIYTYLSITELALLCIAIFLAYDLARSLSEFEGVIEKVTFPKHGERVIEMKAANEDIKTEFIRSRRHNRPLSLLVIEMDPDTKKISWERTVQSIQKKMLNRYLLASLAQILLKEARRTDLIIEQDDQDGFILLCPETTAEGSFILVERIQNLALDRLGIVINCGVAAFPDEALTFEDLLQKARCCNYSPGKLAAYSYPGPHDLNVDRNEEIKKVAD
jgi:GGDEF domain-containing protein